MKTSIDPLSPEFLADPYPFLTQQRKEGPVAYTEAIDMWIVTRHEDVEYVFLNPDIFSASNAQSPLMSLCDEAMAVLEKDFQVFPSIVIAYIDQTDIGDEICRYKNNKECKNDNPNKIKK